MHKRIGLTKDLKKQSFYLQWLFRYAKPYLPRITLLLIFDVANILLGIVMAVLSKQIIDSATGGGLEEEAVFLYIFIVLVSLFITAITGLFSVIVNERFSFGIRKQVYEKIINSNWMDIKKYHTGDLLTRLTSDAGNIGDGIVNVIPTIIILVVELIATFFTLFYYQPLLAVLAVTMSPAITLVCFLLGRKLKKMQVKVQESEAQYRSYMQESLSNLLVIKAFTAEEYAAEKLTRLRDKSFYWIFKKNRLNTVSSTIMALSFNLAYIGAFAFGAVLLSSHSITYGTMSIFLTLINRIQTPFMSLAQYVPKLVNILASAERVVELQNIPDEEKQKEHIKREKMGVAVSGLTFAYNEENILENANTIIYPGEMVAIVGESGIGKTTLIRIIMSFINNVKGDIKFFNKEGEIEGANAGTREFISYVPQGNTLFSGSIRENLLFGNRQATKEEMEEALKLAAAYDFVLELPKGLDTVIGEQGHGISEGQAQRIAIARAFLKKAPFMILDEATSALDEKTEVAVLKGIKKLASKPTCLLITHRKSVLIYCDKELSIENKKVLEGMGLCYNIARQEA